MEQVLITYLKRIEADISELKLLKKETLTFKEACEYLQVSSSTLYKLTCKEQIPHYCPTGKRLYFRRVELDEWLLRNPKSKVSQDDVAILAANYLTQNPKKQGGMA
ncbi:helix-turn-helix domain-containing protein [Terrimonas alba]|uniref:helix-turn-helix domain-containing protein n=1 Tax=Terrimonas alba TaxID=3349636 RepID=UPI0035F4E4A4